MTNPTSTKPREEIVPGAGLPVDRLREAGSEVVEKAQETLHSVGAVASNALPAVGQVIGQTADKVTAAAGGRLKDLGETVARKAPKDGLLGNASQTVAQGLEQGGDYLSREGLSGAAGDLTELIRRHPLPAVLLGLGVGFLMGRILGSRS
jgi:ElaB/YqjD/DUF883 family membrane-anchored ribosome-binding protein